ncbi:hypothetical protein CBS63078_5387 [Aspergillus niger]|nr:hypothetical protein CBS13152_7383 [Aspergillus niger]KAI2905267.1 hypothetical protein CBS63078_5387 [Aspergillus niger]KAI2936190.1 hypothetical protein CBS147321_8616 [Aspergillus niger]KAI2974789.1 hypothetical protein CBS147323_1449 [Aspergillus niger]KAI3025604.1 hypothetical protein CBS147347_5626 [Aspergillus niger]
MTFLRSDVDPCPGWRVNCGNGIHILPVITTSYLTGPEGKGKGGDINFFDRRARFTQKEKKNSRFVFFLSCPFVFADLC